MTFNKITLDLETENVAPKPLKAPSPHWGGNYIVAMGVHYSDGDCPDKYESYLSSYTSTTVFSKFTSALSIEEPPLLIGQNIKFDLLHLLKNSYTAKPIQHWYKLGGTVWDTMLVEYLLSAQSDMFPSLDAMARNMGLPLKDDRIKEYWDDGVPTSKIPKTELLEYMKTDVMNTYQIYKAQRKLVAERGIERFVMAQMEALLATTFMEHRGMHFNVAHADSLEATLQTCLSEILDEIVKNITELTGTKKLPILWNPASPVQLSKLFYGGHIKYTVKEEVKLWSGKPYIYKSGIKKGQIKYKTVDKFFLCTQPKWVDSYMVETKDTSTSTGEEVLKNMLKYLKNRGSSLPDTKQWRSLLEDLLEFRGIHKELNTYVKGYTEYAKACFGTIHPNYNHVATATGRLSCSNPNLQNVTRGK